MPGVSGLAVSESAEGTPRDPANVAPIIAYLASDQAAEVTGQCFGASGYRITRYTHIRTDRAIFSDGPWTSTNCSRFSNRHWDRVSNR